MSIFIVYLGETTCRILAAKRISNGFTLRKEEEDMTHDAAYGHISD